MLSPRLGSDRRRGEHPLRPAPERRSMPSMCTWVDGNVSGSSRAPRRSAQPPRRPPRSRRAPPPSTDRRQSQPRGRAGAAPCGTIGVVSEEPSGLQRLTAAADRRRIAVIALRGVIGGAVRTGDLVHTLAEARRSPRVRAVLLEIDSPGAAPPSRRRSTSACAGWRARSRWSPGSGAPGPRAPTSPPAEPAGSSPSRRPSWARSG